MTDLDQYERPITSKDLYIGAFKSFQQARTLLEKLPNPSDEVCISNPSDEVCVCLMYLLMLFIPNSPDVEVCVITIMCIYTIIMSLSHSDQLYL